VASRGRRRRDTIRPFPCTQTGFTFKSNPKEEHRAVSMSFWVLDDDRSKCCPVHGDKSNISPAIEFFFFFLIKFPFFFFFFFFQICRWESFFVFASCLGFVLSGVLQRRTIASQCRRIVNVCNVTNIYINMFLCRKNNDLFSIWNMFFEDQMCVVLNMDQVPFTS
jgi:hypothetical protein